MRHQLAAATLAAFFGAPAVASAGAWTLDEGTGQVINTFTYYTAEREFGPDGDVDGRAQFTKLEYSPYIEYGVSDGLTVGVQPYFQYLQDEAGPGTRDNAGLADVEAFARHRLWSDDRNVVSVQGLVSVPGGYDPGAALPLGRDQIDLEARLLWGRSYKIADTPLYHDVSVGYRKRFEAPGDEAVVDLTLGVEPAPGWQILAQSFNTIGLDNANGRASAVQTQGLELDRYKLQLSVVRDLTAETAVQVGGFTEFAGRNTGQGNAGFVALWLTF